MRDINSLSKQSKNKTKWWERQEVFLLAINYLSGMLNLKKSHWEVAFCNLPPLVKNRVFFSRVPLILPFRVLICELCFKPWQLHLAIIKPFQKNENDAKWACWCYTPNDIGFPQKTCFYLFTGISLLRFGEKFLVSKFSLFFFCFFQPKKIVFKTFFLYLKKIKMKKKKLIFTGTSLTVCCAWQKKRRPKLLQNRIIPKWSLFKIILKKGKVTCKNKKRVQL